MRVGLTPAAQILATESTRSARPPLTFTSRPRIVDVEDHRGEHHPTATFSNRHFVRLADGGTSGWPGSGVG